MTDVAIREEQALEPAPAPTSQSMAKLADWVAEARAAATLAQSLCRTSFVPDHFRNKPEETTAAILTGHELGMSPLAAVRAIFVIKGTPGLYAKAMVAVVQAQGHDVWAEEQSDERVVMCGRRKGSEHTVRTVWDRERVIKAKLQSNAKYQENPQQMMYARASAEICRQIASDALHGVPYAVEELYDFDDKPIRAEVVPQKRLTAAEVMGTPAPVSAPPAEPEPSFDDDVWPETVKPGGE